MGLRGRANRRANSAHTARGRGPSGRERSGQEREAPRRAAGGLNLSAWPLGARRYWQRGHTIRAEGRQFGRDRLAGDLDVLDVGYERLSTTGWKDWLESRPYELTTRRDRRDGWRALRS